MIQFSMYTISSAVRSSKSTPFGICRLISLLMFHLFHAPSWNMHGNKVLFFFSTQTRTLNPTVSENSTPLSTVIVLNTVENNFLPTFLPTYPKTRLQKQLPIWHLEYNFISRLRSDKTSKQDFCHTALSFNGVHFPVSKFFSRPPF